MLRTLARFSRADAPAAWRPSCLAPAGQGQRQGRGQPLVCYRLLLLAPPHSTCSDRHYHRTTFVGGKEEKGGTGGGGGGGSGSTCGQESAPTLRPEEAAAACKKSGGKTAAAKRIASAFSTPTAPPLCAKPLPPPKPDPQGKAAARRGLFGRKKKQKVLPSRPKHAPQPTRTLLPRSLVQSRSGEELPPQLEPKGDVTWPTRPVITRIRVCTPQEVRKLFQPPVVVQPIPPEPRTMKQTIMRVVGMGLKGAIAGFIVWLTIDQGIWGDSEDTAKLLSEIQFGNDEEPPPDSKELVYKMKENWNRAVVNAFWVLLNTKQFMTRLWKYIYNQDEDDVETPLPDTHDVVP